MMCSLLLIIACYWSPSSHAAAGIKLPPQLRQPHSPPTIPPAPTAASSPPPRGVPARMISYRYYPRSRARHSREESVPFLLMGSECDNLSSVARCLSENGYSALAVGLVTTEEEEANVAKNKNEEKDSKKVIVKERLVENEDGDDTTSKPKSSDLVCAILDAMGWKRAVVVGCDAGGAKTALEAALNLSQQNNETKITMRVAGLVLCSGGPIEIGPLNCNIVKRINVNPQHQRQHYHESITETLGLRRLLAECLDCPAVVVWDGDADSSPIGISDHERRRCLHGPNPFLLMARLGKVRTVVTERGADGGADSPPLSFSVDPPPTPPVRDPRATGNDDDNLVSKIIIGGGTAPYRKMPQQMAWVLTRFVQERLSGDPSVRHAPHGIVSPGAPSNGSTVVGRVVAQGILYATLASIAYGHYGRLRTGVVGVTRLTAAVGRTTGAVARGCASFASMLVSSAAEVGRATGIGFAAIPCVLKKSYGIITTAGKGTIGSLLRTMSFGGYSWSTLENGTANDNASNADEAMDEIGKEEQKKKEGEKEEKKKEKNEKEDQKRALRRIFEIGRVFA